MLWFLFGILCSVWFLALAVGGIGSLVHALSTVRRNFGSQSQPAFEVVEEEVPLVRTTPARARRTGARLAPAVE